MYPNFEIRGDEFKRDIQEGDWQWM
jgi:hypothetical protein